MVLVRPVSMSDLDALVELAGLAGVGLTTLPKDRELLSQRVARSLASFSHIPAKPGGESYLLVMEDVGSQRVIGACGITSKVGGFQPFYAYRIEASLFESKIINVHKEVPILKLVLEHDGPCEIGSLFLHPDWRHDRNGRMLQLVRFVFMAEHRDAFESTVVSEIRGTLDSRGHSPFWDALGQHFFDIDFAEADRLSIVNKKFIADLMPDHPIYIPLLPIEAQKVIGEPHQESERAVKNLAAEGFRFSGMVDIFDAGPVMIAQRDEIRTVRQSRRAVIESIDAAESAGQMHLVGTTGANFRAIKTTLNPSSDDRIQLAATCAAALNVRAGDAVRIVRFDSAPKPEPAS